MTQQPYFRHSISINPWIDFFKNLALSILNLFRALTIRKIKVWRQVHPILFLIPPKTFLHLPLLTRIYTQYIMPYILEKNTRFKVQRVV